MKKTALAAVVILLLTGNVILGAMYLNAKKEFNKAQSALAAYRADNKILNFTGLFIGKVLKADKEVDFETRLALENMVRDIGDEEILAQWKKFTKSESEEDIRKEVVALMEMLVSKIGAE